MGMNLECMLYLQKKGHLTEAKSRLLDVGPQNVYFATESQIAEFVRNQGQTVTDEVLNSETQRVVYFSTPRPEERTTLLSEITDLTNIDYNSFDVCPALKTEILDLNFDELPEKHHGYFDVVLNFGTTEHVFNQWNSYKIMHEALKVGGVAYHQLPGTGYLDHGYYCYTPVFFADLAKANGYETLDIFFTPAGLNDMQKLGLDIRSEKQLTTAHSATLAPSDPKISCYNINAVLRKSTDKPFRATLELATSHSAPSEEMAARYADDNYVMESRRPEKKDAVPDVSAIAGRVLARELLKRIKQRLFKTG